MTMSTSPNDDNAAMSTHQYQDLTPPISHDYQQPNDPQPQYEEIIAHGTQPDHTRAGTHTKMRCLKEDVIAVVVIVIVLLHIALLAAASLLPAMNAPPLPSFDDPVKGFEPRGMDLSNRLVTLRLKQWNNDLTVYPQGQPAKSKVQLVRKRRNALTFCGFPTNMFIAFESTTSGNLFNAKSFKEMCHLEEEIVRSNPEFNTYCDKSGQNGQCCSSFSLGNMVASVVGKSSCHNITDQDVSKAFTLLEFCAPYFVKGLIKTTCYCTKTWNGTEINNCPPVPCECFQNNAVLVTMNYLTDSNFLLTPTDKFLKYSLILVPVGWGQFNNEFFTKVYNSKLKDSLPQYKGVKVVGFDFGNLKYDLFNFYLIDNVKFPALAMAALLIIMSLYLNSIIISFCGLLSIIFALVDSYFLYKIVFGIKFFPFLNVATLIFLVGIGADDAFVYYDIWRQTKAAHPDADCMTLTLKTLRYAALSMFVTSLTTSAAFFASVSSHITSIKCFGIFAGLSILTNYLMMVTWFPAVVLLHERWVRKRTIDQNPPRSIREKPGLQNIRGTEGSQDEQHSSHNRGLNNTPEDDSSAKSLSCLICWGIDFPCHFIPGMKSFFGKLSDNIFERWLPNAVLKKKLFIIWIVLFVGLTVGFLCVIFVSPKMSLPTSKDFQVFPSSSTLEQYEMKIKYHFRYAQGQGYGLPIDLVWGVKAADNGNHLNPDDLGTLQFEDGFDPFSTESQKWLMDFSKALGNQTFYSKTKNNYQTPFENFVTEASSSCLKNYTFPYPEDKYKSCYLKLSSSFRYIHYDTQGKAKALRFRFWTDTSYSSSYQAMEDFWNEINGWTTNELAKAPSGLNNGWAMCVYLDFYNLQVGISSGTFTSMGISISIAFAVMLLTTLNIFISLYAILTIIGILSITVGTLVLLGWQLNILESIVLSVAVGLSIDFTMHYGVAYRLSPHKEKRDLRVRYSFMHIGSAIFMAAITTFIAGALMMPAVVLVYNQMGVFLMLVMFFSYVYATFVFQSFCAAIGPVGNFGQLSISRFCPRTCRVKPDPQVDDKSEAELVPVVENNAPQTHTRANLDKDTEDGGIVTVL